MQALISPSEAPISYISSWNTGTPPTPVYSTYLSSCRVAQVEPDDQTFPVGGDLFWTSCADNVVADQYYYDTVSLVINPIVNAPKVAAADQPVATGTQTL